MPSFVGPGVAMAQEHREASQRASGSRVLGETNDVSTNDLRNHTLLALYTDGGVRGATALSCAG